MEKNTQPDNALNQTPSADVLAFIDTKKAANIIGNARDIILKKYPMLKLSDVNLQKALGEALKEGQTNTDILVTATAEKVLILREEKF